MLFLYFNYIFNIWEWFNVNGYHLVMLSGVNTLRYMHILKEMRNFKWVFLEAVFKWVWPKRFIWVWADRRLCIFALFHPEYLESSKPLPLVGPNSSTLCKNLPLFQFALSKLRLQTKTKTWMWNFTCYFKITVSSSDETSLSSLIDPVTSNPRMRTKNTKNMIAIRNSLYAK